MVDDKLDDYDVLVISRYNMGKGGLENVVKDQVITLLNLGLKTAIAFRKVSKHEKIYIGVDAITVYDRLSSLPAIFISDIIYAPVLYYFASKLSTKILLDNFDFTILYAMFLFSKKRPVIVKVHHGTPNYLDSYSGIRGVFSRIYKLFLKLTLILSSKVIDLHIAVSDKVKQELVKDYHILPERIIVIYNGIDIERFKPRDKLLAREKLGLSLDKSIVLFVGHDMERKGYSLALKVVEFLRRFIPDIMFIVVTSPKHAKKIRKLEWLKVMSELSLDHLALLYNASDVLLFPSRYDSFGLVAVEAIASGCPAIVSTNVGALDYKHSGEGYLVANSLSEYLEYCKKVLTDDKFKSELVKKGRFFVTSRYDSRITRDLYGKVILSLLKLRR
jgi:glycosyltransferase involved in cell wall biosynthesis